MVLYVATASKSVFRVTAINRSVIVQTPSGRSLKSPFESGEAGRSGAPVSTPSGEALFYERLSALSNWK